MGVITNTVLAAGSALLANKNAKKASSGASAAAAAAETADTNALDFVKEQYEDWKKVFGPIQDNLAKYYNELSPATIEAKGLEAFEMEKTAALTNVREVLAQRGIATSGIAGGAEAEFAAKSSVERARIRAEAPMKAAQEKTAFLSAGLGQDPRSNVQTLLNNRANSAGTLAANAINAAAGAQTTKASAITSAGTAVADILGGIFKPQDTSQVPIEESVPVYTSQSAPNSVGPLRDDYLTR